MVGPLPGFFEQREGSGNSSINAGSQYHMALFQVVTYQDFIVPYRIGVDGEVLQHEYRVASGELVQQGLKLTIQLYR